MGRPRKPTALKLIHGSRDRHNNKLEPMPTGVAEAPDWISEAASIHWNNLAPSLIAIGLLTEIDGQAFAVYCQSYAELIDAESELLRTGKTQTTKDGFARRSPWLSIRDEAHKRMQQIGGQFGFTPASRTKIETKPVERNSNSHYIA